MKDFFKPEDFDSFEFGTDDDLKIMASKLANDKLNKLIESWPVVYCTKLDSGDLNHWTASEKRHIPIDTHKARLAFIEEIKKEPCKHEPELHFDGENETTSFTPKCKHCGVELQATWSEK